GDGLRAADLDDVAVLQRGDRRGADLVGGRHGDVLLVQQVADGLALGADLGDDSVDVDTDEVVGRRGVDDAADGNGHPERDQTHRDGVPGGDFRQETGHKLPQRWETQLFHHACWWLFFQI